MSPLLRGGALLALACAFLLVSCAGPKRPPKLQPGGATYEERGEASWYGKKFHGRTTASGERFDMYAMTAAHPTLPFGTVVEVTNLRNGRAVRVRINDRGPFRKGRIIDLSYAAASALEMIGPGVVPVRVVQIGDGDGAGERGGTGPRSGRRGRPPG